MMAYYETNRQVIHLSKAKRCSDQADHLYTDPRGRIEGTRANTTLALWKRVDESACGSAGNDKESQAERTAWR